jgi:hypothetical protein
MEHKLLMTISIIILLSGCQYKVDNTNSYNLSQAVNHFILTNDTTILQQLFTRSRKRKMSNASIIQNNIRYYDHQGFHQGQPDNKSFNTKRLRLIKIDTLSWYTDAETVRWYGMVGNMELSYQQDSTFFVVSAEYWQDTTDKSYYITYLTYYNINEECEGSVNEAYAPELGVTFKTVFWDEDYYGKTFKSGAVKIKNNLDQDIDYIKFKIILEYKNSFGSLVSFFNQTIVSNKTIYQGDLVDVEIPQMQDYHAGFIIQQKEISFTAKLIDIKPKPKSDWCIKLKELKHIVINK